MHFKTMQRTRYTAAALALLVTAACGDSPISPTPVSGVLGVVDQALSNKPPLDQTLEGEAWVCKDGTGVGTFTFAVSIDGAQATNHSVALGTCALVHTVPTDQGQVFATVSVTEVVPQDWTLNSAIVESNNSNTANYQPAVNLPNASGRMSHDWGIVITFTNTYTPPPPPPGPSCTLTQGYWKNHGEDWDQVSDGKPFLTTTTFYNSGKSYLAIMGIPPKGGNAYLQLAHQFIAASLNVNGGSSGVAAVDAALSGAAAYFAGAAAGIPNPVAQTRSQLRGWATTLDNFNNGRTGPGHCN